MPQSDAGMNASDVHFTTDRAARTASTSRQRVLGQAGVNQLGGIFVNGRPLPFYIRQQIVEYAEMGVRPCDISRQLLVSHGCVSKILSRYYDTGSISPGAVGGQLAKQFSPLVMWKIAQFKQESPHIMAKDVRELLLLYRIFDEETVPNLATLNKMLRNVDVSGGGGRRSPFRPRPDCGDLLRPIPRRPANDQQPLRSSLQAMTT